MSVWPHQLLSMPFPLDGDNGRSMAELRLPARGLTRNEAERLKLYIDSLVIEQDVEHEHPIH